MQKTGDATNYRDCRIFLVRHNFFLPQGESGGRFPLFKDTEKARRALPMTDQELTCTCIRRSSYAPVTQAQNGRTDRGSRGSRERLLRRSRGVSLRFSRNIELSSLSCALNIDLGGDANRSMAREFNTPPETSRVVCPVNRLVWRRLLPVLSRF